MKKNIIVFIILLLTHSTALFPAIMFDPQLEWSSIKTEHFWIHYHQGIEEEALKLSLIAERVHKRLSAEIKWEPALRTDVVLVDNMYTANGFSTPFPFNKIQIYLSRPEMDSVLGNFDNWLDLVFTHEYTHTLNMDTVRGFPSGLRYVFGRFPLLFPNVFVPIWMLEGNAVYQESKNSKFGRNNSTYTDMIMRTEILEKNFKPISEASNFPREWPTGNVPYLYGGLFVDYLEKKYGTGKFADLFIYNSNKIIPYHDHIIPYILPFIWNNSQWVYGESYRLLWKDWEEYIKIRYGRQIENIKKQELTEYVRISDSGCLTSIPRFSRDGKNIYYIRNTNYSKSALMSYSIDTGKSKTLCRVNDPNSLSTALNKKIYLSDAEYYRSYSIYNEAFIYNNGYKKITSRLRGSYIDISPDGKKTCVIIQDSNKFSLVLSDPSFGNREMIIQDGDIQLAFSRFSPDGKSIAFSMKDKNGNSDIAILNTGTKDIERLSDDGYNDIHPSWHPDGSRIIFSSDRNGIYNLYAYDLNNKTLTRLTNLTGGAFSPDISPDGKKIVFACYEKNGFDISLMKYPSGNNNVQNLNPKKISIEYFSSSAQNTENNVSEENDNPITAVSGENKSDYNALYSGFPSFWYPVFGSVEVYDDKYEFALGFYTYGYDTLYKNLYAAQCYLYSFEKRANIDLYYLFGYLYPDIIIQYHDDALYFTKDEFPWEDENNNDIKRETDRTGTIGIALPFYYYHSSHVFSLSYGYSRSFTDTYYSGITNKYEDTEAEIQAKYSYSNAAEYSYSISREDGRDFYLITDFYRKEIGSDLTYSKVLCEYAEYLPGIWRNNVLMARLRGGASFGNPGYKAPYPLGRYEKGETGYPDEEEDEFGLRGYPYGGIFGNRIATAALEYRLPLFQRDIGAATFPVMFRDLWITPFAEYGNVWDKETNIGDFKSSAGIELSMRITLGYEYSLQGYIGYARGFNKPGEDQVYFGISTIIEGAIKNNYKWLDYL